MVNEMVKFVMIWLKAKHYVLHDQNMAYGLCTKYR